MPLRYKGFSGWGNGGEWRMRTPEVAFGDNIMGMRGRELNEKESSGRRAVWSQVSPEKFQWLRIRTYGGTHFGSRRREDWHPAWRRFLAASGPYRAHG